MLYLCTIGKLTEGLSTEGHLGAKFRLASGFSAVPKRGKEVSVESLVSISDSLVFTLVDFGISHLVLWLIVCTFRSFILGVNFDCNAYVLGLFGVWCNRD